MLLVAVVGLLPETARNVVGNGGLDAKWWEIFWGTFIWDWIGKTLLGGLTSKGGRGRHQRNNTGWR